MGYHLNFTKFQGEMTNEPLDMPQPDIKAWLPLHYNTVQKMIDNAPHIVPPLKLRRSKRLKVAAPAPPIFVFKRTSPSCP